MISLFLVSSMLLGIFVAFVVSALTISGLRYKAAQRAPLMVGKALSCDFCLSFWFSLAVSVAIALVLWESWPVFMPVFSTPVAKFFE